MFTWGSKHRTWPDADREVWDRLGGRDALSLTIGASGFAAYSSTYRTSTKLLDQFVTVRVRQAVCTYQVSRGRKHRLRVVESHMTGSFTPSLVIVDIRPAYWTLEWLLWVLDPNGDKDSSRHRSYYTVSKLVDLTDDQLLDQVEDVIGTSINPFG